MSQIIERLESILPKKKLDIFGKNSLLHSTIPYYLLALLPAAGIAASNPNPYIFVAIIYALFPLLDEIFSLDGRNPSNE
jgi:apolipoprotein N-acyltransferase